MLVIRKMRVGRKNRPQFRIVVQEKHHAPTGKHVAVVGSYDPHSKETVLKADEIKKYLENGAQPSDSVYNLLVHNDIIKGEKRVVKVPAKKVEETEEGAESSQDTPAEEAKAEASAEEQSTEEAQEDSATEEKEEADSAEATSDEAKKAE